MITRSVETHCPTSETLSFVGFFLLFGGKLIIFIGVELVSSVVLVSGVQQSESVIYTHTSTLRFFSHVGHYRVLHRVPCAIQQILFSYLFYM